MRMPWPAGRHKRWRNDVDAFVDGELSGERARQFAAHIVQCTACARRVAERRETKRLTMALPTMPVPRSFRLNPGMLVQPVNVQPSRGTPRIARLSQVAAGIAVIGFVAVFVADLSRDDSGGSSLQATSEDDTAPASAAGDAAGEAPATRNSAFSGEEAASPTPAIPEVGSSVGAAGSPETPQPTHTDSLSSGPPPGPPVSEDSSKSAGGESGDLAVETVGTAAQLENEDPADGPSALRWAEGALLLLGAAALLTWAATRRRDSG